MTIWFQKCSDLATLAICRLATLAVNCSLRLTLLYSLDLFYGIIVFAGFMLLTVTDRADFYLQQIKVQGVYFDQKLVLALQR